MSSPLPPLVEPAAELTREEAALYSRHLFRPYLGTGNGHQAAAHPEVRRDEEKAERLYDEAVGEVRSADEAL
mgnify:CR=1 FL=1